MEDILNCMDEDKLLSKFEEMYKKGDYDNCITFVEKKLSVFSNKFYDIMIIYLNSLINTNQKEKALKLVKEELSMPYIPLNFENKFMDIYKEVAYIEKEGKEFNISKEKLEEILCVEEDKNLIILAIVELCKLNIRDYFDFIKSFFKRDIKNIYKVMLVDAMRGQGVNNEFILNNKGKEYKIIPQLSENVLESKEYINIKKIIENKINNKELTICSMALENLMLYLSDVFPLKVEEENYNSIACALHYYVSRMYDESLQIDEIATLYDVNENDCKKYLKELESACSL